MLDLEQDRMQKVLGTNLKKARKLSELSMQQVMLKIWGIRNNKNRLSELETGAKMPTPILLFKLAELYGVSIDYLYGRTIEPEIDLNSQRAGYLMQGLRETGLELMDQISLSLAKQVLLMPKHESEILLNAAKMVINEHKKNSHIKSSPLDQPMVELEHAAILLDIKIARQQRSIELVCIEQIEKVDNNLVNRLYTDNVQQPDIFGQEDEAD